MSTSWIDGAVDVAERLLRQANTEGPHLWWPSLEERNGQRFVESRSSSLWGGTGGVSLFLAELYHVTRRDEYWDAANRSLDWCVGELDNLEPSHRGAFLSGGMGLVYTLCRLSEISGDEGYAERAIALTDRLLRPGVSSGHHDILSGTAGTLLVLLHVDHLSQSEVIRSYLDRTLAELLTAVKPHRSGAFWDLSPNWHQPLCGFAHGGSGIGFALLSILARRECEPLRRLIRDAFRYEDQFYSAADCNWPDHRRSPSRGRRGSNTFFNAWCHGAAGIGLARMRAVELGFKDQVDFVEATLSRTAADVSETLATPTSWKSFTLCHGVSGLGELLLHAGKEHPDAAAQALEVGTGALQQMRALGGLIPGFNPPNQEHCSLFIGSAGIGYFLLRLHDPDSTPPIVAPRAGSSHAASWTPTEEFVADRLVHAMFPRTRHALRMLGVPVAYRAVQPTEDDLLRAGVYQETVGNCTKQAGSLSEDTALRVRDLISLEAALLEARACVDDFVALFSNWEADAEGSTTRPSGSLNVSEEQTFMLLPEARLLETRWAWPGRRAEDLNRNLDAPPGKWQVLVVPSVTAPLEYWLDEASAWLLSKARSGISVGDLLQDHPPAFKTDQLHDLLRSALENGLLRPSSAKARVPDALT